jgi:hypothetical protein
MDGEVDDVGDTEVQDRVDDGTFVDYDAASPETSHSVPSVVKMRLNTFVHGKDDVAGRADAAAAARLKCKLGLLVMEGNILLGEAYAFANYHVLRLLNCNKPVPVIDRNFLHPVGRSLRVCKLPRASPLELQQTGACDRPQLLLSLSACGQHLGVSGRNIGHRV